MGKLDINKQLKRDSLLNTAFQLFTSKGMTKTSISDIVENAGVAKGTFYLYFKDKVDIRNKLIAHKSSMLFQNALNALKAEKKIFTLDETIIYLVDNIVNQLNENQLLLAFISKNLSWGVFKNALTSPQTSDDLYFKKVYDELIDKSPCKYDNTAVMLFMIIELTSSTCYSSILYGEPVKLDELKPHLYKTIQFILDSHKLNTEEENI